MWRPPPWPIGMGRDFLGCYDILHDRLELMDRADRNRVAESIKIEGLDDPMLAQHVPAEQLEKLREELEMARALLPAFDRQSFLEGHLTPIWFGSAINSFGVKELMSGMGEFGPEPQIQKAAERGIAPEETPVTGFVFKVQANMDPKHRDRVAFVRLASGHFERGMKLLHVRSKKPMAVTNPVLFPRRRPRACRGGLGGRHHRHSEPRPASHRRCADRGRGAALHRHPLLRARASAGRAGGRSDEGQASGKGTDAVRRGRCG